MTCLGEDIEIGERRFFFVPFLGFFFLFLFPFFFCLLLVVWGFFFSYFFFFFLCFFSFFFFFFFFYGRERGIAALPPSLSFFFLTFFFSLTERFRDALMKEEGVGLVEVGTCSFFLPPFFFFKLLFFSPVFGWLAEEREYRRRSRRQCLTFFSSFTFLLISISISFKESSGANRADLFSLPFPFLPLFFFFLFLHCLKPRRVTKEIVHAPAGNILFFLFLLFPSPSPKRGPKNISYCRKPAAIPIVFFSLFLFNSAANSRRHWIDRTMRVPRPPLPFLFFFSPRPQASECRDIRRSCASLFFSFGASFDAPPNAARLPAPRAFSLPRLLSLPLSRPWRNE